jgi:low temperature requirement protein LtrA
VIDADLSRASIAQAAFLLLVVWWAWVYTTWMVNWFDPGSTKVRLILACVTLTSLLMSAAIPTAFGSEAWLFAGAYVAMQVGRNVAAMALLARDHPLRRVFARLVAWSCASAVLWIAGPPSTSGPGHGSGERRWRSTWSRRWSATSPLAWDARRPPTGTSKAGTSPSASSPS